MTFPFSCLITSVNWVRGSNEKSRLRITIFHHYHNRKICSAPITERPGALQCDWDCEYTWIAGEKVIIETAANAVLNSASWPVSEKQQVWLQRRMSFGRVGGEFHKADAAYVNLGPVASLGLVSPAATTQGVTPIFSWSHPLDGVTPHLFYLSDYLSDLVCPLFFVNSATKNSFGCHPLEGVSRSGPPMMPLLTSQPCVHWATSRSAAKRNSSSSEAVMSKFHYTCTKFRQILLCLNLYVLFCAVFRYKSLRLKRDIKTKCADVDSECIRNRRPSSTRTRWRSSQRSPRPTTWI